MLGSFRSARETVTWETPAAAAICRSEGVGILAILRNVVRNGAVVNDVGPEHFSLRQLPQLCRRRFPFIMMSAWPTTTLAASMEYESGFRSQTSGEGEHHGPVRILGESGVTYSF